MWLTPIFSQRVSCIRASLAASSFGRRLTISETEKDEVSPKQASCKVRL